MYDRAVTVVLGEMDVARVNLYLPFWPRPAPSALGLVPTPPANAGHPIPGGDSRSASHRVGDVHQARMTKGVGGWGMTFRETKRDPLQGGPLTNWPPMASRFPSGCLVPTWLFGATLTAQCDLCHLAPLWLLGALLATGRPPSY